MQLKTIFIVAIAKDNFKSKYRKLLGRKKISMKRKKQNKKLLKGIQKT